MGEEEDIEIEIVTELNTVAYIDYKYERYFYNAKTGYRIGFRYFFYEDEGLNKILDGHKYYGDIHFYESGKMESIVKALNKYKYYHKYYETGGTSEIYYLKNPIFFYEKKGYTTTGRTNYKISYNNDGEKRSRIFYWHGPRLPEEDGHMMRYDRRGAV